MFGRSFNSNKCKSELRMAASRIKVVNNARTAVLVKLRREVAVLLEAGQDINARVKVEHVIREENALTAYGLILMYCEIIVSRLPIIETQKKCPIDLREAISGIIFASPRCADIAELPGLSKKLKEKYGKEFTTAVLQLRQNCGVSSVLVEKLSTKSPNIETKVEALHSIAGEHGIEWEPKSFDEHLLSQHEFLSGPISLENTAKIDQDCPELKPSARTSQNTEPTIASSKQENINQDVIDIATIRSIESPEQEHRNFERDAYWESHHMDFKDPVSAALAAARSAEMANVAANAAFELAARERAADSDRYISRTGTSFEVEQDPPSRFPESGNQYNQQNDLQYRAERRDGEISNGRVQSGISHQLVNEYDEHSPVERRVTNCDRREDLKELAAFRRELVNSQGRDCVIDKYCSPQVYDVYDDSDDARSFDSLNLSSLYPSKFHHDEMDGRGVSKELQHISWKSQRSSSGGSSIDSRRQPEHWHSDISSEDDEDSDNEDFGYSKWEWKLGNSKHSGNFSEVSYTKSSFKSDGRHRNNAPSFISDKNSDGGSSTDSEAFTNKWKNQATPSRLGRSASYASQGLPKDSSKILETESFKQDQLSYTNSPYRSRISQEHGSDIFVACLPSDGLRNSAILPARSAQRKSLGGKETTGEDATLRRSWDKARTLSNVRDEAPGRRYDDLPRCQDGDLVRRMSWGSDGSSRSRTSSLSRWSSIDSTSSTPNGKKLPPDYDEMAVYV